MAKTRPSRRSFLEAMGASAAFVPLLNMNKASAAVGPKRLVLCAWTNGFWRQELWPEGEGDNYKLRKILSPLEPYRKHLLPVAGLKLQNFLDTRGQKTGSAGAGHDAYPTIFVGDPMAEYNHGSQKAGGDSVDQYVAERLNAGTPFKSLVVSGRRGSGYSNTTSYKGVGSTGVTPEGDPARLFRTLFEGRSLKKGEIDRSFLKRQSVLDHLGKGLDRFAARVGAEDRMKIQQHAEAVRELEKQVVALSKGVQCAAPSIEGSGTDDGSYPRVLAAQNKLIAAALRCDLTRVVNFTMEDNGGDFVMSWLGPGFSGGGDEFPQRTHHDIAHNRKRSQAHVDRYVRVGQWFFENVAALVKELASTPEGTGSMLDNTLVCVGSPMHHNHTVLGIPFIIIGGSWYFKTNRFLKLGPWKGFTAPEGPALSDEGWWSKNEGALLPHNGLLVGLCNAMGVPTTHFGPAKYGGEIPELRG